MFQPGNSFTATSLKVRIGTMVTRNCQMSKRTGQIFWLDRIKQQQLDHATSFINIGIQVHNRVVNAKKEINFHSNKIIPIYIDMS